MGQYMTKGTIWLYRSNQTYDASAKYLTLFFMFFTLNLGDIFFLFSSLAYCVRDESCTGKLALISPKSPKFVAQSFVYIYEEFAIKGMQP